MILAEAERITAAEQLNIQRGSGPKRTLGGLSVFRRPRDNRLEGVGEGDDNSRAER